MKSDNTRSLIRCCGSFRCRRFRCSSAPASALAEQHPALADGLEFELTRRNTPGLVCGATSDPVTDKLLNHIAKRQAEQFRHHRPSASLGRRPSWPLRLARGRSPLCKTLFKTPAPWSWVCNYLIRAQPASPIPEQAELFSIIDKKRAKRRHTWIWIRARSWT